MFIINPGSGPVINSRKRQADAACRAIIRDAGLDGVRFELANEERQYEGRYIYWFIKGKMRVEVMMPGVTLKVLRGDLLHAPRLYIDGSSWFWKFAVGILIDKFGSGNR